MKKYDVIVIGSGIGGLCCGSILALSGKKVLICEAHTKPGGVAHSFNLNGYKFESGPSLWSGIGRWPTTNPLGQILKLLDEKVELTKYQGWQVNVPEGNFNLEVGQEPFKKRIRSLRGNKSVKEWDSFLSEIKPLSKIVSEIPLLSFSPETINFIEVIKLASKFLPNLKLLSKLNGGFGDIVDNHLKDPFLRNWVDLLSFLISGMPMQDTNTAAMTTLFSEWFGTMFLLATVIGSGIMAENLAAGNIAIALLGNTIPTGAILVVLITILGPISGAHLNPAVTVAFLLRGEILPRLALAYVVVQVIGAFCGAVLAHFMFELPLIQESTKLRTGMAQWVSEFMATFGLLATIFGTLRWRAKVLPMMVTVSILNLLQI